MQSRTKLWLAIGAALLAGVALAQTATRFAAIRVDNLTSNRVVLGGGTSQLTALAAGTTTTLLHGNAAGSPSYGAVALAADVSGTLPAGNGGLGITTTTDDTLPVGSGSAWVATALTSCSSASSAVTYNTTTNAFGCNSISSGASQTTGNFTASFTDACTTTPTMSINYVLTGAAVTWRVVSQTGFSCTGDSTGFATAAGDLPAAIRPAATETGGYFGCTDNGNATACSFKVEADGTLRVCVQGFGTIPTGNCVNTNWTNSGVRNVNTVTASSMGVSNMSYQTN